MRFLKNLLSILILISVIVFIPSNLIAQEDGDEIVIGTYKLIDSKILNEKRTLLIHLPRGYDETEMAYPVLYLLYGDHVTTYFAETVAILDRLGSTGRIPPMILVSVMNTDRYRDLLPRASDGSPTGIDDFQDFFREELIPWVERNYRTKTYRVIVGPQAGANFGLYTLVDEPDMFDAFILNQPFRWRGGRDLLVQKTEEYFRKLDIIRKFVYITYVSDDEFDKEGIKFLVDFRELVNTTNPGGFILELDFREDHDEFLQPLGLREGIKRLFENYPFPDDKEVNNLQEIADYYKQLSNEFGFEVDMPEHVLSTQSDKLSERGKREEALEIWEYMRDNYPRSGDAYWRLALYYREMGNKELAIEYLKKLIDLYPDVAIARRMLEELEKESEK
ncbi:MAG: tetratricopeptide repeat protein [Bacteroidales bacterium]|nr:MAG: tetratricopeptide repeat protein [Bacteroidales bacterium]